MQITQRFMRMLWHEQQTRNAVRVVTVIIISLVAAAFSSFRPATHSPSDRGQQNAMRRGGGAMDGGAALHHQQQQRERARSENPSQQDSLATFRPC